MKTRAPLIARTNRLLVVYLVVAVELLFLPDLSGQFGHPSSADFQGNDSTDDGLVRGFLRKELYLDVPGIFLTNLTQHPKFPDHPDRTEFVPVFEIPLETAQDLNNYGARLSGFLIPPETGQYTFYLSSDDQGALFLSLDEYPAHKSLIAFEPGWSGPRTWTGPASGRTGNENISVPMALHAGLRYYVEALMKEGGGGDHIGVAWQKPGDPVPANGSPPIGAENLAVPATWLSSNLPPAVRLLTPTNGAEFASGANILLGATASDTEGELDFVEFFASGDSLGRAAGPYRTPYGEWLLTWSNVPPGAQVLTARATDRVGLATTSSPVAITVSGSSSLERELHVVGIHEAATVSVVVDRPGKAVMLFLSAYNPVTWQVSTIAGSMIEQVILGGYYTQRVVGLPSSVPVVQTFYEANMSSYLWIGYQIDAAQFQRVVPQLHNLTGLEIASFQGQYGNPYPTYLINRMVDDPRLRSDFPQPVPPSEWPVNPTFRLSFFNGSGAGNGNVFHRTYTLAGPPAGSALLLPGMRVVADAGQRFYYAANSSHGPLKIDSQTGVATQMQLGSGVPELSWPMCMAFDLQRERVLLASLGGEGFLYAYAPQQYQWSLVASMNSRDVDSLVYHASDDRLCALEVYRGDYRRPTIFRYSASGVYEGEIQLPVLPYDIGVCGYQSELVSVGDYLVLLVALEPRSYPSSQADDARMYLIDPRSGQSWLTYRQVGPPPSVPPVITSQPASLRVLAGQSAAFSVVAVGTPPLSCQWLFNGEPIPAATQATFTRSNVQPGDAGFYQVVVSNAQGAITSVVAKLAVRVQTVPTKDQSQPAVAGDGQGYLIVWMDARNRSQTDYDIYGTRVAADGTVLDPGGIPICSAVERQDSPQVAFDGTNYLVVWSDGRTVPGEFSSWQVYGARVSRQFQVLDPNGFRIGNGAGSQCEAEVAFNGTTYLVVWDDWRGQGSTICDVFGARVTPAGVVLDPSNISICARPLWQTWAHVAGLGGDFYVVWDDTDGIRGTLVRGNGAVVNPNGTLLGHATNEGQPAVAASQSQYLVTWYDARFVQVAGGGGYYSNSVVLAKRLSAQGAVLDASPLQLRSVNNVLYHSDVSGVGADFWSVWQEGENSGATADVRGVQVGGGGTISSTMTITAAAGEQMRPDVASSHGGGGLVVWEDGRHASGSGGARHVIYAARIGPDGQVLDPEGVLIGGAVKEVPLITWRHPGEIVYGTALGDAQLNATANVPGTFVYSPTAGTVLNAGTDRVLTVHFAPTDSANYTTTEASVRIAVQPAPLTIRADDKTKIQGEPNPPLTATYTGFVSGDNPSSLDAPVVLATIATINSPPGIYPITVQGAADADYAITHQNGTLTVLPRPARPGSIDLTFAAKIVGRGAVLDMVQQSDGKLVVVGTFTNLSGVPRKGIVRLLPGGQVDRDFVPEPSIANIARRLAIQPDGKVLIACEHAVVNGRVVYGTARLLNTGSLDSQFSPPFAATSYVSTLAVQPDGRILAGGWLALPDGSSGHRIVRLLNDGSLDPSFLIQLDNTPLCVLVQPDGRILAGGHFQAVNGMERFNLVQLWSDGEVDTSFDPSSHVKGQVNCLVLQPDGRILAGGSFHLSNTQPFSCLTRLHVDGSLDQSFDSGATGNCVVTGLALQPDGKVLAGGCGADCVNLLAPQGIVRLNVDGSRDSSFDPGTGIAGEDNEIKAIELQPDGRIVIAGEFSSFDGVPRYGIARLNGGITSTFPLIVRQPASQTRFAGQTAALTVVATGAPPLSYQWLFNNTPVPGTTHSSFLIPCASPADAGLYSARVSNPSGTVQSESAQLQLLISSHTGPGAVDFSFDLTAAGQQVALAGGPTADDSWGHPASVNSIAVLPNGQIFVAGDFVGVNDLPAMNYARMNGDGSVDRSLDSNFGADGELLAAVRQKDGRMLIAGEFSFVNAQPRQGLARLEPDGRLDAHFHPAFEFPSTVSRVFDLALEPDGNILVAGYFNQVNGVSRGRLARLQPDGSLDPSFEFNSELIAPDGYVGGITRLPDGRLLVFGDFPAIGKRLIRLLPNGQLDSGFDFPAGELGRVVVPSAVAVQPDGRILVAYGYAHNVARLHPDGSLDTNFQPGARIDGFVYKILIQPDGKILLGGAFDTVFGEPRRGIARLLPSGKLDEAFDPGDAAGPATHNYDEPRIRTLALLPDGRILVGAETQGHDSPRYCFFRLNPDGAHDPNFEVALNPDHVDVTRIIPLPDGKVMVAGDFQRISSVPQKHLARLNADGSHDASFDASSLADSRIQLLARQPDGRLLVSGWFTSLPGVARSLVRLEPDGAPDPNFQPVYCSEFYGYAGQIATATLQTDGKIILGGSFWQINGVERRYLARLHPNGSLDPSFVPAELEIGDDWFITAVVVQQDGKIVVAGHIFDQPWSTYFGLARLHPDGSEDLDFRDRVRVDGPVFHLLLQPDDKILFTGSFETVNGALRPGVARLNADGSLDTGFVPPELENCWSLIPALAPDGKVVIGGWNDAIWLLNPDGSVQADFQATLAGGPDNRAWALAVQADGDVWVSGDFKSINGVPMPGLARLNGDLAAVAPQIVRHPVSQTVLAGGTATFTVGATGTAPLHFQWKHGRLPIHGATSATLVLQNVRPSDEGPYTVVVSNHIGTAASSAAMLTVLPELAGAGSLDPTFDPTAGLQLVGPTYGTGRVTCVAQQLDGRTLIGGTFAGVNGRPRNRIARLLPNGALDESFNPGRGVDGVVKDIAVQPDGRVILVGGFTSFNGAPCTGVARLIANGAADPAFAPPLFPTDQGSPACVAIQPDGRFYLGGNFKSVNGSARRGIARFNPDGSLDPTLDASPIMSQGLEWVQAILLQPDGKLVIAGHFGALDRPLMRLNQDGTVDASFQPPEVETTSGSNLGWVHAMAMSPGGRIVIVGRFGRVNGVERSSVARLNPDGSLDTSFAAPAVTGQSAMIARVLVQPDGKTLIGGKFNHLGGLERRGLARLFPGGAVDAAFDPAHAFGTAEVEAWINDLALRPDGRLVVAAGAEPYSCCPILNPLCQLNPNGSLDVGYNAPEILNPAALPIVAQQRDGRLLISQGAASTYNGQAHAPIARLRTDGTLDPTFSAGFMSDGVSVIVVQPNGRLLVGGSLFRFSDGRLIRGLVRLMADGSVDPTFTVEESPAMQGEADGFFVTDLLLQPDGRVVVVGWLRELRGSPRGCIARLLPDGRLDATFAFSPPLPLDYDEYTPPIHCAALEADGRVLIGASFTDGSTRLLRLSTNGAPETELLTDVTLGMVAKIVVQPDRKILVAGSLRLSAGADWTTLARVHPDGSLDSTFAGMLTAQVNTLVLQPDGKLLLAARDGGPALLRLNMDGSPDNSFVADLRSGSGPGNISRIVLQPDGRVVVSGSFSSANGIPWYGIARLHNDLQLPQPFVVRQIAADGSIRLVAAPANQVSVYAVEDQPPAGWPVVDLSPGGVFDATTGKVKFGPFFDHQSRTMSYQVQPPPGAEGVFTFIGTASADGVNSLIGGDQQMVVVSWHPAEVRQTQPADWRLSIDEVTAYASAWRRGLNWIVPPNPIPMDYMTRAATLWRQGECYQVDARVPVPPLWWVTCAATAKSGEVANSPTPSQIERMVASRFVPGESLWVTLDAAPPGQAFAYAIEEHYPTGWQIESISHGGEANATPGIVRWGPFFDATPRQLHYRLKPPLDASGMVEFFGRGSFDGVAEDIAGARQMQETCRLTASPEVASGAMRLTLSGREGGRFRIEASADLQHWELLGRAECVQGRLVIADPGAFQHRSRFYRAVAE